MDSDIEAEFAEELAGFEAAVQDATLRRLLVMALDQLRSAAPGTYERSAMMSLRLLAHRWAEALAAKATKNR
jgi:hypothetical protein